MYDKKDLNRILRRNLRYELDVIKFYLDNLKAFNYSRNKKKIDALVLESVKHSDMFIKEILELNRTTKGKLMKSKVNTAMKEEMGAAEIYSYQINKTRSPKIKKTLKKIVIDEKKHEKLVNSLK
ncbi:ferritin family protein [Thermoproteota archaeon]